MRKINVFLSYAHADEDFKNALDSHLALLRRSEKISTWSDRAILGGAAWDDEIKTQLAQADMILLLISASFINSNYIWNEELTRAMARHEAKSAVVIPIFIKPCDWSDAPFGSIQGLPRDAKPVARTDNDTAWMEIAKGIRAVVDKMAADPAHVQYSTPTLPNVQATFSTQQILDWPDHGCLRPTFTKMVLNELLVRRQSVNLTGGYGQGKTRLLHDLRDMAATQGLPVALLDLKEHRLRYDQFLRAAQLQLQLDTDYAHFEDLCTALSRQRDRHYLLLIDNLEVLNEYASNDPCYDARFVAGLNMLKNLPNIHLLCASREWLKQVVFQGETSLLTLHRVDISPLNEQEIQAEFQKRLEGHPFLEQAAQLQTARLAVQAATHPCILLEDIIRRVQSHYDPTRFDELLNTLRHGQ
jgi:TIR domain